MKFAVLCLVAAASAQKTLFEDIIGVLGITSEGILDDSLIESVLKIMDISTTESVEGVASPAECAKCAAQVQAAQLLINNPTF